MTIRAELRKAFTTRMVWALLAVLAAFVALNVVAGVLASGLEGAPSLQEEATVRSIWASAGAGGVLVLVLGILAMTTEYRHQTITATFLATPRRGRVVATKMVAYGLIGLLFAFVAAALTATLAPLLLSLRDAATVDSDVIVRIVLGGALATALYGVLGVAFGALVRNQIAAVVIALVWVLLAEALLVALLPAVGKWLPGGAASAMVQATAVDGTSLLPAWGGALLMTGYAVGFGVLATLVTVRRDVT
jgi:ABC-2 type transport system permease protein